MRATKREQRHQQELRELKDQAAQSETVLRAELEVAQAKVRDLQKRLFGRKSESRSGGNELVQTQAPVARRRPRKEWDIRTLCNAPELKGLIHPKRP
ncbi:MAG: hypothetical protein JF606_23825 [Burkholderiales bacterium]|nr:hypothetical protein [Burkholderiales bacterium]